MQCFFITQRSAGEGTEGHRGNKLFYFWVGLKKLSFANPEVSSKCGRTHSQTKYFISNV
jgi:hypothetical protein